MSEKPSGIRAVCFDAGNVLTWFDYVRVSAVFREFGHEVTPEAFVNAELLGRDRISEVLSGPGASSASNESVVLAYFDRIREALGVPKSDGPGLLQRFREEGDKMTLWCHTPPEVPTTLEELRRRGYPLAVISNTARGDCERVLEHCGIRQFFPLVIDSFHVGVEKPHPKIFLAAAEKLQLQPGQILFIGDLYLIDVVGARNVGMYPVLLDPRGPRPDHDCTVITNFAQLLDLLPGVDASV